ncbi:MAG: fused MFS/spermidine synthase [Deltaproteobacteria bacterium]|nr:fused MFS/spermidine synthase [Deltaproteobacteria bacterium]
MLVLIVGNTIAAASMLVAAFMGGLALGSYWGGRTFSKLRPSLLSYSFLEVCIGLYVVLSPFFFKLFANIFSGLAPAFADSATLPVIRLAITFASLFAPAFLMGATFPAIIAGTAHANQKEKASRTGYLYSINTIGAALGCLTAGYVLLPKVGSQLTMVWAFSFNMAAAGGGLLLNAIVKKKEATPSVELKTNLKNGKHPATGSSFLLLISIATFIVGFAALSYEALLTRLVILYFGNQLIVFTLVLTAFLLGTGY